MFCVFVRIASLVTKSRALDKKEYLMIIWVKFCPFCIKMYVVTPIKMVQMRGHNIMVSMRDKKKIILQLSSNTPSYLELCKNVRLCLLLSLKRLHYYIRKHHKSCQFFLPFKIPWLFPDFSLTFYTVPYLVKQPKVFFTS